MFVARGSIILQNFDLIFSNCLLIFQNIAGVQKYFQMGEMKELQYLYSEDVRFLKNVLTSEQKI